MATQAISGLISGLDTESIVSGLMELSSQNLYTLEDKVSDYEVKLECYQSVNTALEAFYETWEALSDEDLWKSYSATSTDEDSLTVSATKYASEGTYSFQVTQLAQTGQYASATFDEYDESLDLSSDGTITIVPFNEEFTTDTELADFNGGDGVSSGSISITDSDGNTAEIDLSGCTTVGEVIDAINAAGLSVTASVNSDSSGILLTDTGTAGGTLTVEEVDDGTTASDLNLLGEADGNEIDGSFATTIEVNSTDSLEEIMERIAANTDYDVSVVTTGSGYRLLVSAEDTGEEYGFTISSDIAELTFTQTSKAQDAIIQYGGTGTDEEAITLSSSSNTFTGSITGLTLNAEGISDGVVTVTIAQDTEAISTAMEAMVESYNELKSLVNELDQYISEDDEDSEDTSDVAGLLYNDSSTRRLMSSITEMLYTRSDLTTSEKEEITSSGGVYIDSLFDLGLSLDDDGLIELDSATLDEMLSDYFSEVSDFMYNTEDAADSKNGAVVSSSPTAGNGTSALNIINGNIDVSNFGANNGFEAADTISSGADSVTITFDEETLVDYLVIYHVNTDDMPSEDYALSDFTVEYLDSNSGEWETLREITDNTSNYTVIGTSEEITTTAIRITASATNADDDKFRLTEVVVNRNTGMAQEAEATLTSLTDDDSGYFATLEEYVEGQIESLGDDIEDMEERLEAKEEQLWESFNNMESALAELESESSYLDSVLSALNSDS